MFFIEYDLTSDLLFLGERPKGGIFKPCLRTIPFSQITGVLNARFGRNDFKAVGYLRSDSACNDIGYLTYAPRDRHISLSKIPLQVEFLSNVTAAVFVRQDIATEALPEEFEIHLGGLRSRGFGRCQLKKRAIVDARKVNKGSLNVRIPLEEGESFNIRTIIRPVYGYLFKPLPLEYTGEYVLSLFEGSELVAPPFLLKEGTRG